MKPAERGDDEEFTGSGLFTAEESHSDGTNERYATQLTSEQSKAVNRLKAFVLVVLIITACVVSWIIYTITRNGEVSEFKSEYEAMGMQIVESFQQVLRDRIYALSALGVAFTLHAEATNSTWPFVTMNHFQERSKVAMELSGAMFIQLVTIVEEDDREEWEKYSLQQQGWVAEAVQYQKRTGASRFFPETRLQDVVPNPEDDPFNLNFGYTSIAKTIFGWDENFQHMVAEGPGPYQVMWQASPFLPRHGTNMDLRYFPTYSKYVSKTVETEEVILGGITTADPGWPNGPNPVSGFYAMVLTIDKNETTYYQGGPFSEVYIPIFDNFSDNSKLVAVMYANLDWASLFENTLQKPGDVLDVVLNNACDGNFTYSVSSNNTTFVGAGNLHDRSLSHLALDTIFDEDAFSRSYDLNFNQGGCPYSLHVYPTKQLMDQYLTPLPKILTALIAGIMAFTIAVFFIYNWTVERRQKRVLDAAIRTNAIVSSIFPEQVRDRLEAEALLGTTTKLRGFLKSPDLDVETDEAKGILRYKTKPIADFFASVTIMFADVEGFTAWSSTREPFQVFSLLESLYGAFDQLAAKHRIYKVETVGDCYVAVSGLPDPRKDHAVAISRFAVECVKRCVSLTKRLEVVLGPDTGDLRIRVGLHSGEVTAGVLRGSRSRFQLFGMLIDLVIIFVLTVAIGDTVNTASRIESTGEGNRVHVSAETANLLVAAGKGHWLEKRKERVLAKGKGEMETFWLKAGFSSGSEPLDDKTSSTGDLDFADTLDGFQALFRTDAAKLNRLIRFNVEILSGFLKQILARRAALGIKDAANGSVLTLEIGYETPFKEVKEIVVLPELNQSAVVSQVDTNSIELSSEVSNELHMYIRRIAQLYNSNPFHNFEHASHVTLSVVKLLSRIVAPSDMDFEDKDGAMTTLHDHTYGITSDPLTQFSCVLSALIHDASHSGVTNAQLIKEKDDLASKYNDQSIAEQFSLDISWNLLMEPEFANLRAAIYLDKTEMKRFRQLLVNEVLSTDITDKELKALRNARWDKAFKELDEDRNRRATIVIEHLIQASDVAHTMQHWHVYRKWNERFFMEMFKAYKEGRADSDPSLNWYQGELGFFDFYIIPLAKKLKDCGIFGVSSDEYLSYATRNRQEWEVKGREIVTEMVEKANSLWESNVGKGALSMQDADLDGLAIEIEI